MPGPLISIVIPAYNQAQFLKLALDSCLAQSYKPLEIVVVDDGSQDGTADVARRYGDPVRFIQQANQGTAAARNRGIEEARGDAIALLDHDDLFVPRKLELQAPLLQNAALVYGGIEVFDSASGRITSTYLPPSNLDVQRLLGFETIPPQTFLFWKRVFLEAGGFDARLSGVDDWDFSIRAAARHAIVGVPQALTRVRTHLDNQGHDKTLMFRACRAVLRKNARLHPGCRQCREALRRARRTTALWYYEFLRDCALRSAREGRYMEAAAFGLRAAVRNPWKALHVARGVDFVKRRMQKADA